MGGRRRIAAGVFVGGWVGQEVVELNFCPLGGQCETLLVLLHLDNKGPCHRCSSPKINRGGR